MAYYFTFADEQQQHKRMLANFLEKQKWKWQTGNVYKVLFKLYNNFQHDCSEKNI